MARIHRRTIKKKALNDPDKHNGVVTYLEPDILECEGKGAIGSITMKKGSGGDGIPADLFQILKDDAVSCTRHASKFGKLSSVHKESCKKSAFIPIPKKSKCQRMFKLPHNCTHLTR